MFFLIYWSIKVQFNLIMPISYLLYFGCRAIYEKTYLVYKSLSLIALINQTHVRQNNNHAHHRQGGDIHWLQSGFQTRTQHGPGTIPVLNDGLLQNTRRRVDGPGTKQSPIFTQGKITKINRTISEPPTRNLLVWNAIWFILHALYRRRQFFLNPGLTLKNGLPSFMATLLDLDLKFTSAWNPPPKDWMRIFPAPRFISYTITTSHFSHC